MNEINYLQGKLQDVDNFKILDPALIHKADALLKDIDELTKQAQNIIESYKGQKIVVQQKQEQVAGLLDEKTKKELADDLTDIIKYTFEKNKWFFIIGGLALLGIILFFIFKGGRKR